MILIIMSRLQIARHGGPTISFRLWELVGDGSRLFFNVLFGGTSGLLRAEDDDNKNDRIKFNHY